MPSDLGNTIRELRVKSGLSQQQLAAKIWVNRTTITNWETGRRIPDVIMLRRLADIFGIHVSTLMEGVSASPQRLEVIVVDDERIVLSENLSVVEEALPGASIVDFTKAAEAIDYARFTRIGLAFLDVEIGIPSGLDLCRSLLEINPETNVIFLTAFEKYAFDAWETGACGFLLKPFTVEEIKKQLHLLRHPIDGLELYFTSGPCI